MNINIALSLLKFYVKSQAIIALFLCAVLLIPNARVSAFETDQYNLPPKPLADIGDEVRQYAEENLTKAINKLNVEIFKRQICLEKKVAGTKNIKCDSPQKERLKLAYLRSEEAVAREVYKRLGDGIIPFTKSGSWMESHDFKVQPARYKTDFSKSIFRIFPPNYLTISKTVNVYGSQFGTDKIAHFFQQGYAYYKKYNSALAAGLTPDESAKKAVRWGKMTERTFYGTLVSGVYSNADLCANYVGMKFYQNLTRNIKIGDSLKPAVLLLENGIWKFNEQAESRENLLKPFFSDHLNEALNPSVFIVGLRSFVRRTVKKQSCKQWFAAYPNLSKAELIEKPKALTLWNGGDYGFKDSQNFVTIANTCFDN
ncbi:MAG: hypothetical protein M3Q99_05555 [Acidobacteriota bacterium]|nr:hypothetical protein [Acidobacteriota bacterium]